MKRQKTKLRDLAPDVPHCMGCDAQNYDRQRLCLAHSQEAKKGRGMGLKSHDIYGAYLDEPCHWYVDYGTDSKEVRAAFHHEAWLKTFDWWIENNHVGVL